MDTAVATIASGSEENVLARHAKVSGSQRRCLEKIANNTKGADEHPTAALASYYENEKVSQSIEWRIVLVLIEDSAILPEYNKLVRRLRRIG